MPARELGTNIPWSKIIKPESFSKRNRNKTAGEDSTAGGGGGSGGGGAVVVGLSGLSSGVSGVSGAVAAVTLSTPTPLQTAESQGSERQQCDLSASSSASDDAATTTSEISINLTDALKKPLTASTATAVTAAATVSSTTVSSEDATSSWEFSAMVSKINSIVDPNEPIFTGTKHYHEDFVFWQLIDWYKAGSGEPEVPPDLFGAVSLPKLSMCFGESITQYDGKARDCLLSILRSEKAQVMPWPTALKTCFNEYVDISTNPNSVGTNNNSSSNSSTNSNSHSTSNAIQLMGSPTLDVALGQVDSVHRVLKQLGVSKASK